MGDRERKREAEYSFMMGSKCASLSAAVARLDTRDVRPFEERRLPPQTAYVPSVPSELARPTATGENPNRGFRHSNQKRPPLIGDWIKLRNGSRLPLARKEGGKELGIGSGFRREGGSEGGRWVTPNLETERASNLDR